MVTKKLTKIWLKENESGNNQSMENTNPNSIEFVFVPKNSERTKTEINDIRNQGNVALGFLKSKLKHKANNSSEVVEQIPNNTSAEVLSEQSIDTNEVEAPTEVTSPTLEELQDRSTQLQQLEIRFRYGLISQLDYASKKYNIEHNVEENNNLTLAPKESRKERELKYLKSDLRLLEARRYSMDANTYNRLKYEINAKINAINTAQNISDGTNERTNLTLIQGGKSDSTAYQRRSA